MIDADYPRFLAALGALAHALPMFGREYSAPLQRLYLAACGQLSIEDFEAACLRCLRECAQFPVPGAILDRAPQLEDREVKAGRVFLSIVRTPRHNPASGAYWREDDIAQRHGPAAGHAFVAAGGTTAFRAASDPDKERFIRRDFVACFLRIVTADPATLLPASTDTPPRLRQLVRSVSDAMSLPTATAAADRRHRTVRPQEDQ